MGLLDALGEFRILSPNVPFSLCRFFECVGQKNSLLTGKITGNFENFGRRTIESHKSIETAHDDLLDTGFGKAFADGNKHNISDSLNLRDRSSSVPPWDPITIMFFGIVSSWLCGNPKGNIGYLKITKNSYSKISLHGDINFV